MARCAKNPQCHIACRRGAGRSSTRAGLEAGCPVGHRHRPSDDRTYRSNIGCCRSRGRQRSISPECQAGICLSIVGYRRWEAIADDSAARNEAQIFNQLWIGTPASYRGWLSPRLQPQLYQPADGFGLSQLALCPISGGFRIGEPVSLTVASGAKTAGRIGSGPGSVASDVRTAFLRAQISAIRFCRSADLSRRMRVRTSRNCSMVHPSRHATPISGLRLLVVTDWMLVHI